MPVKVIDGAPRPLADAAGVRERRLKKGHRRHRGRRINVAFLNNMGDAALAATERQFLGLLEESAGEYELTLRRYRLETLARAPEARAEIERTHRPSSALKADAPDALIVTGAEPKTNELDQEAFWRELAGVIDFARDSTHASYFSCLAAHAAVLRLDGVRRRKLARKLTGVFTLAKASHHALTEGFDWNALAPHSRWNTLDEAELVAKGYQTVTRSAATGPDLFVKPGRSLLTFSQGHPEYDADTLGREFRRDLRLYAEAKRESPPLPPQSYFMPQTEVAMMALAFRAERGAPIELGEPARPRYSDPPPWRRTGAMMFQNWLTAIAARKDPEALDAARIRLGG